MDAYEAIERILTAPNPGHKTEDVEAQIRSIIEVLVAFIGHQMQSAKDLNNLAGWERFMDN